MKILGCITITDIANITELLELLGNYQVLVEVV